MQEIVDAVVSFPTVTFTAALVVVVGFWVFVFITRPGRDGRHPRAATGALDREGIAATAAASLVLGLSWILQPGRLSAPARLGGCRLAAYGAGRTSTRRRCGACGPRHSPGCMDMASPSRMTRQAPTALHTDQVRGTSSRGMPERGSSETLLAQRGQVAIELRLVRLVLDAEARRSRPVSGVNAQSTDRRSGVRRIGRCARGA